MDREEFLKKIWNISSPAEFDEMALELFQYQANHCAIYAKYLDFLQIDPRLIQRIQQIPFLPIEIFKSKAVKTGDWVEEEVFTSSGTSNASAFSKHFVRDLKVYENSFHKGFENFYGNPKEWIVLALLPSYLERKGSSLIYMTENLISASSDSRSGFFLHNHQELAQVLQEIDVATSKVLLLGVTFALLDFAEAHQMDLKGVVVMETGGMKGRREEWTREQVHTFLKSKWNLEHIHSEYGMTELLGQAYSRGDGLFECQPWMKVLRRDTTDPLATFTSPGSGGLNVIDLSNFDSCGFIATQDLTRIDGRGRFEVLGRFDHADARGCNLMVV